MADIALQQVALLALALALMAVVYIVIAGQVGIQTGPAQSLDGKIATSLGALVSCAAFRSNTVKKNRRAAACKSGRTSSNCCAAACNSCCHKLANRHAAAEQMITAIAILAVALALIAVVYTLTTGQVEASRPLLNQSSGMNESVATLTQLVDSLSQSVLNSGG